MPDPTPSPDNKSGVFSGILDLFKQIFGFISDKFGVMPKWVQIPVYLGFAGVLIYGIFSYVHPVKPVSAPALPDVMEIHGTLTFTNGEPIPPDSVAYDFSGLDVYVCKRPLNAVERGLNFDWIMRYTKSSVESKSVVSFVQLLTGNRYCSIGLKPSELLTARDPNGDVHLEVNRLLTKITLLPAVAGPPAPNHADADESWLLPAAYAQ